MIDWLAKTWGFETNNETPDFLPTEYSQGEYSEQSTSGDRYTSTRTLDDIVIEGSGQFVNHVNRCIDELRGTKWESLVAELRKITQCSSGAYTAADMGIEASLSMMGCDTWNNDYIEGAATLIHEAVHTTRVANGDFDETNYAGEERLAYSAEAEFFRHNGNYGRAAQSESKDGRHNEKNMSAETLAMQR